MARTFTLTEYMKSTHMAARVLDRIDPKQDVRVYPRWLKAWRKEGWKCIWTSDRRDELYRLEDDPEEERNLIVSMPEKADEMRVEMEDCLTALPHAQRIPRDFVPPLLLPDNPRARATDNGQDCE